MSKGNYYTVNTFQEKLRKVFTLLFLVAGTMSMNVANAQLTTVGQNLKDACDGLKNGSIELLVTNSSGSVTINVFGPNGFSTVLYPTDGIPEPLNSLEDGSYITVIQDSDEAIGYNFVIGVVTPDLSASLNAITNNTDCTTPNGAINIDVSGGTGTYTYQWTEPNGFTASTQDITGLIGGDYSVDVFDAGTNCFRSLGPFTVTDPAVAIQNITTTSPLALCPGVDAVIDLDGSESGKKYEILVNGSVSGAISTGTGAAISLTLSSGNFANGDVLTVEGFDGLCPTRYLMNGSVTISMSTESVAPTAASADNENYCNDGTIPADITLSYTGGTLGTGASAEWYDDAAFTSNVGSGNNILITPAPSATITYYVRFEGTCNTTADVSVTITVDNPADPTITPAGPFCLSDGSTNLTAATAGGTWSGAGITDAALGTFDPATAGAGTHTITYTVNSSTCVSVDTENITVNPLPTVTLTGTTTVCFGDSQTYTTETGMTNYSWAVAGGTVTSGGGSTNNTVTVTWDGTTPYSVSVNYQDGNGCSAVIPTVQTITVNSLSIAPTSATADNPSYCSDAVPADITLTYAGGSLGSGATAEWYDDAAFTSSVGSGNNVKIIPAPSSTTTYYVRFEGTCNTTAGQNVTVTVASASSPPTTAGVDSPLYCDDAAPADITLTYSGGSLGTGATAEWYDDAAFTSNVGSGNNLNITPAPSVTTTYYVRFESSCGNTTAQNITVTVDKASVAPTAATADNPSYCNDAIPTNITLSYSGGSLGTGATAEWYDDAAFTSNVGSGNNLLITPAPSATITYYVRFEGSCNTTTGQSVTVTVDNASAGPTGAGVDSPTYCDNAAPTNITLTYSGGSLGTGATAEWYDDAAFTSNVGSGNNLVLAAPNVTTTYFIRFEGACGNTAAQNIKVNVDNTSIAPTSASVDKASYCDDVAPPNITLSYSGGSLGNGATAEWYDDAAFTSNVGSGNNLVLTAPTATTIYYVRFEGSCNTTTEQSVTVTVENASIAPASANVDKPAYCDNAIPTNITLSYTGGSLGNGATAEWYDDAALTTNVGSGNNLSLIAPAVTTTYFVRFEGTCNITTDKSVTVDIVAPLDATITGLKSVCNNTTVTYSAPAGATTYAWTLSGGDGTISSGAGTATITVDWGVLGGKLAVDVTGAAPTSCVSSSAIDVTVYTTMPPLPDQSTDVCQDSSYPTLTATPVLGATVNWYLGASIPANLVGTGDTYTPTATELDLTTPGTTTFTYVQDIGCVASADAAYDVIIIPLPDAGLDSTVNSCLTDGTVDLVTQLGGTPDTGGTWNDDDNTGGLSNGIFDPTVSGVGTYNFTYMATGLGPCSGESASAVLTVVVVTTSESPVADQATYLGCTYATPPTLTVSGINVIWYADAALTNQIAAGVSFTPRSGVDIDTLNTGITSFFATQNEGCGESESVQVDIELKGLTAEIGAVTNSYPEQNVGSIEVINFESLDPPYDIMLEDAMGNIIYDWEPVDPDPAGEYSYLLTQIATGDYVVWVGDAAGCTFPLIQSISPETAVFIPNVFTPNNDGYNEYFKVLNKTGAVQIIISNRWGVKVFESDDYQNDWQADSLPEGVYFYTIKMDGEVYKGNVEVWRNAGPAGSN